MSERREHRRIERSAGTGSTGSMSRAWASLGTDSYFLEIWQTFHVIAGLGPGPAEEVEGLKEIRLRLVRSGLNWFQWSQGDASLTFQLEDGRRIDIQIRPLIDTANPAIN